MSAPPPPTPDWLLAERAAVGRRLRAARAAQHLSQETLGEQAGLDRRTIGRFENASSAPDLDQLLRIAHALDMPLWRILWGD
ncbi:helix-turn-helix transcriptional regulator [Kitasatospora sp. McL0602]|uniref:helix-turn-helix transcriptional regulator n=1 Tax=Kitasatospora sp. McL0602 TaxID=3439530 RepID=UPI003F89802F